MHKQERKLFLNKETIRVLTSKDLRQIWGGDGGQSDRCLTGLSCPVTLCDSQDTDTTSTQGSAECGPTYTQP